MFNLSWNPNIIELQSRFEFERPIDQIKWGDHTLSPTPMAFMPLEDFYMNSWRIFGAYILGEKGVGQQQGEESSN